LNARRVMMESSLLSGFAISQTRTALAHSISYPLSLAFDLPHGIACSFCLPQILRFNSVSDDGRLQQLALSLGYDDTQKLADALNVLLLNMGLPGYFSKFVDNPERVLALTNEMLTPGRADNNLRLASVDDVRFIVRKALEF
jgi:alcohol dehydrogenase